MCFNVMRIRNPAKNERKRSEKPFIDVPCGKCPDCVAARRRQWVLRMKLEYQYCTSCLAITLTYDNPALLYKWSQSGDFNVLDKRDIQKFVKKLRYYFQDEKSIKYYIVGEYGDTNGRCHWHCVFFNAVLKKQVDLYNLINQLWYYGTWQLGDNKGACYSYMCKYLLKPELKESDKPPIVLISKGLGLSYLESKNQKMLKFHRKTESCTVVTFDGQRGFLPKYLREKIWPDEIKRKYVVQRAIKKLYDEGVIKDIPCSLEYIDLDGTISTLEYTMPRSESMTAAQHAANKLKSITRKQHHL